MHHNSSELNLFFKKLRTNVLTYSKLCRHKVKSYRHELEEHFTLLRKFVYCTRECIIEWDKECLMYTIESFEVKYNYIATTCHQSPHCGYCNYWWQGCVIGKSFGLGKCRQPGDSYSLHYKQICMYLLL